jgi:hypothetical protein
MDQQPSIFGLSVLSSVCRSDQQEKLNFLFTAQGNSSRNALACVRNVLVQVSAEVFAVPIEV